MFHQRKSKGYLNKQAASLAEIGKVVEFWSKEGVSAKHLRRRLRYLVAKTQRNKGEFRGHRSQRGRALFDQTEARSRQRGSPTVEPVDFLVCCLELDSEPVVGLFDEMKIDRQQLQQHAKQLIAAERTPMGEPVRAQERIKEHRIAKYGRDLTALARAGRLGPVIGRDDEIKQIARILVQRSKNNPLLLGDPGVGKTAIVEGLASYAAGEQAVEPIRNFQFVEISVAALLSGAMYRGQFEERVQEVLQEAQKDKNLIIFMDEIHTLMGSGADRCELDVKNFTRGNQRAVPAKIHART